MTEILTPRAITPMRQSLETSCVPTSISMVFSGFGVDINEQTLIDNYFQTAKLPRGDSASGVTNGNTVRGTLRVIEAEGLKDRLQLDVFAPYLYEHTASSEQRYIVQVNPRSIKRYARQFKDDGDTRDFYETLADLAGKNEIGVYTANSRIMGIRGSDIFSRISEETRKGFYSELTDFIKKGHIIGPHGGMTAHMRALDGTRMEPVDYRPEEQGFVVMDTDGESYVVSLSNLVWVDSMGVRGDVFDYLFRVSPREKGLNSQSSGFRAYIQRFRALIP